MVPVAVKVGVLQFAKKPVVGEVKTRLTTALSAEQACDFHKALLTHVAMEISQLEDVYQEIWSTGDSSFINELSTRLSIGHKFQKGKDLGERLCHAISSVIDKRDVLIVVGSDCPFLNKSHYLKTVELLGGEHCDIVLAPALDGGYVLLAMSDFHPELFRDISWGSGSVLQETLDRAKSCGLKVRLIDTLRDIDRPEDLSFLPESLKRT